MKIRHCVSGQLNFIKSLCYGILEQLHIEIDAIEFKQI